MVIRMPQIEADKILARIYGKGRGAVCTPKDFHDLASSSNIRTTLSRLVSDGKLRRLMRGVYEYPEFSPFMNAPASPNPNLFARAVARNHGWTIQPEGNTALNLLGLSTQVPAQWNFFSDGPTKRFQWTGGILSFKHRTNKETTALSYETALLVQALKTLGQDRIDDKVLCALCEKIDAKAVARAVREAQYVTSWVYAALKRLAAEKERSHA
ncbi:MAG: DUF6088 family protein [Verrucomicrobiota bacterium]|jgi:hypothetical protein